MEACELKGVNNVFIRDNKAFPQRSMTDIPSFTTSSTPRPHVKNSLTRSLRFRISCTFEESLL